MKALLEWPLASDDRELGRMLNEQDRALAAAVVNSDLALTRLCSQLEQARGRELGSVLRLAPDGRREREAALSRLQAALHGVLREPRGCEHAVEVLTALPVHARIIERVLRDLERELGSRDGPQRLELERSIARIRSAAGGAESARRRLLESNMPLVLWMARRRVNHGLPLSDLVQEGTLGLMRAIEKFDAQRDVRFSTYAVWWIRHAMNRALSYQSRAIRLPVRVLGIRRRIAREAQKFVVQYGRAPTPAELATRTSLPADKVAAAMAAPKEPLSLELPRHGDAELRLGDTLAAPSSDSPSFSLSEQDAERSVTRLLEGLRPREREILRLRFGMSGEPHTLAEIGKKLGLTRERIRQIEAVALKKLRRDAEKFAQLEHHSTGIGSATASAWPGEQHERERWFAGGSPRGKTHHPREGDEH